jgi:heme o synthase
MINYYLLTKPGIIIGNLITFAAGFLLASKGIIDFQLFFATLLGLALIMASACVFNNYIDRQVDKKMERTKNRALVKGLISGRNAILFAIFLGILGNVILLSYTNLITIFIASVGFFVYVVLYSLWKCRTIYGTAIGSVAGAVPPVVGYCAVSNHLDAGALILFAMMVLWQMPHFFSIAMSHFDDYAAANIPVLPIKKGAFRTKIHMVLYIVGFISAAVMLTLFNYTGYIYLLVAMGIGLAWLALCIKGFNSGDDKIWGRDMFRLSLLLITSICFVIPFDIVL